MAQSFIFKRRINGVIETFYPNTTTDNVVRKFGETEKPLNTILDEKGGFRQYSEQVAEESAENDLMFEVLGDVYDSESIHSLRGTIIGNTPPSDTRYMWLDKSSDIAVLKFYDEDIDEWRPVDISGGRNGVGTIVGDTEPVNTSCLWVDTSGGNGGILKYYDTSTSEWIATTSVWG